MTDNTIITTETEVVHTTSSTYTIPLSVAKWEWFEIPTAVTFEDFIVKSHPTGSSYTCDPPVLDTDIDTIILATDPLYVNVLLNDGWTKCSSTEYPDQGATFTAFRRGKENYIVTCDKRFYKKYVLATKIAKEMNLLDKADRIKLFNAVLYNVGL